CQAWHREASNAARGSLPRDGRRTDDLQWRHASYTSRQVATGPAGSRGSDRRFAYARRTSAHGRRHATMMTPERGELLRLLGELSAEAPDLRLGQLVANLATLAQGAKVEAIWDAEDDELIAAAERLLAHYRERKSSVA